MLYQLISKESLKIISQSELNLFFLNTQVMNILIQNRNGIFVQKISAIFLVQMSCLGFMKKKKPFLVR